MAAYLKEEFSKKEKALLSLYEEWKILIRTCRENLKNDISESELARMADTIEKGKKDIKKAYNDMREGATPSNELRRKTDACEAVSNDILKKWFTIVYQK